MHLLDSNRRVRIDRCHIHSPEDKSLCQCRKECSPEAWLCIIKFAEFNEQRSPTFKLGVRKWWSYVVERQTNRSFKESHQCLKKPSPWIRAEASFSYADKCVYLYKAKQSPGQIVFTKLSSEHREAFEKARIKEVKSLLDNKAIRVLSVEESKAFRKAYPDHTSLPGSWIVGNRMVTSFRYFPSSLKIQTIEPMADDGVDPKSRWCVCRMERSDGACHREEVRQHH